MTPITFYSTLTAADGYGRAAGLHMQAILAAGGDLFAQPLGDWSALDTPPHVYDLIRRHRLPTRWGIAHHWPPTQWEKCDSPWIMGYTMLECTRLPDWFRNAVNRHAVAIVVPSLHQVELMTSQGIQRPVYQLKPGLDSLYSYADLRATDGPVTFGTLGTLTARKGTDILLRAWEKAFPTGNEDVRLTIKVRGNYEWAISDSRIRVVRDYWSVQQTETWYQSLDCYVSPTRGEGFGLTLVEAMACGCAVIGTDWSAPAEYLTDEIAYPLPITGLVPVPHSPPYTPEFGEWANPDEDALTDLMRAIAADPTEARLRGKLASKFVSRTFPLRDCGKRQLQILEELDS